MIEDPILDEIHETRARLLADCDGDLDRLLDGYQSSEGQDRARTVSLEDIQAKRRPGSRRRRAKSVG